MDRYLEPGLQRTVAPQKNLEMECPLNSPKSYCSSIMLSRNKKLLYTCPQLLMMKRMQPNQCLFGTIQSNVFFFLGISKVSFGRYSAHIYSSQNPVAILPSCKNTSGDTRNTLMHGINPGDRRAEFNAKGAFTSQANRTWGPLLTPTLPGAAPHDPRAKTSCTHVRPLPLCHCA